MYLASRQWSEKDIQEGSGKTRGKPSLTIRARESFAARNTTDVSQPFKCAQGSGPSIGCCQAPIAIKADADPDLCCSFLDPLTRVETVATMRDQLPLRYCDIRRTTGKMLETNFLCSNVPLSLMRDPREVVVEDSVVLQMRATPFSLNYRPACNKISSQHVYANLRAPAPSASPTA
jgi:hypothetical protein